MRRRVKEDIGAPRGPSHAKPVVSLLSKREPGRVPARPGRAVFRWEIGPGPTALPLYATGDGMQENETPWPRATSRRPHEGWEKTRNCSLAASRGGSRRARSTTECR